MTFERYDLFEGRSLAHRLFKRHHTHFNNIYWSQRTSFRHLFSLTKNHNKNDPVTSLFTLGGNEVRDFCTLGDWGNWYSDFDRWSRMAYIIGLAGYLETYIAQVATAAFESSPSLILGGGPKVDGATFLKHNSKYNLYSHSEPLTKGDWQARASAYKRYFSSCPFSAYISELEWLRGRRNDVGHTFGRDIKSMHFAQGWEVKKLADISDKDIMNMLNVIESVANAIEKDIAKEFIGQYEVVKVYHQWISTQKEPYKYNLKQTSKLFRRHFYTLTSGSYTPSIRMINYYNSL
ncbi:hypothetical protein JD508_18800 [Aeromonas jandaei]|uniref:hypothetical protein n=1 Tax=Aeromonas jandaei TaxID=650 RepID=UPI00191D5C0F|nr:hypothetical protein [Aeromonas jandaei]MBL0612278.1 hypothetical protein [Aeromonas jandaei]